MRLRLRVLPGLTTLAGAFLISTPTPAQAAAPTAAGTYRGEGDDVIRIPARSPPSIVKATHQGEANFIVWALSSSGKEVDLVANAIGDYKGTAAFNINGTHKVRSMSVTADGPWTLQVLPSPRPGTGRSTPRAPARTYFGSPLRAKVYAG